MHELSIAMSLVEIAEEELARHAGRRVGAVHIRVGRLAGVVADALVASYELASEHTALEGSRLVIEDVAIATQCPVCGTSCPVSSIYNMRCDVCGTPATDIVQGRELLLTALEFDS
jgi:hydrogenase nickel incorporation protein HypA/HybF